MDGIANVLGRMTVPLVVHSRAFTLSTMTLGEYAERESFILARRPAPLVCAALPKQKPLGRRVKADELELFLNSSVGLGWRLWRGLRKCHGAEFPTVDDALSLIDRATPDEAATIRHAVELSEEADLLSEIYMPGAGSGNSDGGAIPWAAIVRNLSGKFGWLPEQIGRLTLYQALLYSGGRGAEDGIFQIDAQDWADFRSWQQRRELAGFV